MARKEGYNLDNERLQAPDTEATRNRFAAMKRGVDLATALFMSNVHGEALVALRNDGDPDAVRDYNRVHPPAANPVAPDLVPNTVSQELVDAVFPAAPDTLPEGVANSVGIAAMQGNRY